MECRQALCHVFGSHEALRIGICTKIAGSDEWEWCHEAPSDDTHMSWCNVHSPPSWFVQAQRGERSSFPVFTTRISGFIVRNYNTNNKFIISRASSCIVLILTKWRYIFCLCCCFFLSVSLVFPLILFQSFCVSSFGIIIMASISIWVLADGVGLKMILACRGTRACACPCGPFLNHLHHVFCFFFFFVGEIERPRAQLHSFTRSVFISTGTRN